MVVAELEVEIALVHDLLGDVAGFGDIRKDLPHLLFGLQIELVVGEAHAVGIGIVGFRADAQQHVVSRRILLIDIVGVVGGDEGDVQLLGQLLEHGVDLLFFVQPLILDLQVKVALAEAVLQPERLFPRPFVVVLHQAVLNLARKACGQGDEALAVSRQQFVVYPGFIVEACFIGFGYDLDEVFVAGLVFRQQDEMPLVLVQHGVLVEAGARCRVDLAADDGLNACLLALLVELHAAKHHAVVRDGQGGLAELLGPGDQLIDARGAVQQTVFRMYV